MLGPWLGPDLSFSPDFGAPVFCRFTAGMYHVSTGGGGAPSIEASVSVASHHVGPVADMPLQSCWCARATNGPIT